MRLLILVVTIFLAIVFVNCEYQQQQQQYQQQQQWQQQHYQQYQPQQQCPDRCLYPKHNERRNQSNNSNNASRIWYYYNAELNQCQRVWYRGIPSSTALRSNNVFYSKASCDRVCTQVCQNGNNNNQNQKVAGNNQEQVNTRASFRGPLGQVTGTWAQCAENGSQCGTRVPFITPGWPQTDCCSYCRIDYYPGYYVGGYCSSGYCYCMS